MLQIQSANRRAARRTVVAIAVTVLALWAVACGDSNSDSSSKSSKSATSGSAAASTTGSAGSTAKPQHLGKLVVGSPCQCNNELYVASAAGLFEKNGLDVEIKDNYAAQIPTALASGQIDLAYGAEFIPLTLSKQGNPSKIFLGMSGGGQGASVLARNDIRDMAQLQSMGDKCTIATQPAPGGSWVATQRMMDKLGLHCKVLPSPSLPSQLAQVVSGTADVMISTTTAMQSAIVDKKAHLIVDSSDPAQYEKYSGSTVNELAWYTTKASLEKNRPKFVALVKSLLEARQLILKMSPDELLDKYLSKFDVYTSIPRASALAIIKANEAFDSRGSTDLYITKDQWKAAVDVLEKYAGVGDVGAGREYATSIDMSVYADAAGVPEGAK